MRFVSWTVVLLVAGCGPATDDAAPKDASSNGDAAQTPAADTHEEGHAHEGDDVLFWRREDIEHAGYTITLGHHGINIHEGHELEPAVGITRDGKPVADAKVFNALLAKDGETVIAPEVPTVYEPQTEAEPAHYAQGGLAVPEGIDQVVIRFRIVLPGDAGETTYDVPAGVEPEDH